MIANQVLESEALKEAPRVLIVDDDPEVRSTLYDYLDKRGFSAVSVASGREAVARIRAESFDVAILDVVMPEVDGMTVLLEFRRLRPKLKVIMLSGFSTVNDAVEAIKKGASHYLTKPYAPSEILTAIRRVIEESQFDPVPDEPDLDNILSSMANPVRRRIIFLLSTRKNIQFTDIARALDNEDRQKVSFHLKILREAGIVSQEPDKSYFLTTLGNNVIHILRNLKKNLSF